MGIGKKKQFNNKVTIINDNIWNYLDKNLNKVSYDVIWLDIWYNICGDNLIEMYPMEALSKQILKENGIVLVWTIKACECMTDNYYNSFEPINNSKQKIIEVELIKRKLKNE